MVDTLVDPLNVKNAGSTFREDMFNDVLLHFKDTLLFISLVPVSCQLKTTELMVNMPCACDVVEESSSFPRVEKSNQGLFCIGEEPV